MLRRSLDCGSGEAPAGAWVQLVPSSVEARSADSPVKKGTVRAVPLPPQVRRVTNLPAAGTLSLNLLYNHMQYPKLGIAG